MTLIMIKLLQFKGPIDASFSLNSLSLDNIPLNQLFPNLSNLSNLENLGLNDTKLTGTIDLAYFPPNMYYIRLKNNQLHGTIPNFSRFTNLSHLSLYRNQFTGSIPDLSSLSQLRNLNLSFNQLTGPIPILPTSLGYCYLDRNQLSGDIPVSLTNLTNLDGSYSFGLSYNHLNPRNPCFPRSPW